MQATTTIQSDQGGYRNGDTLAFTGQVIKKHLIDKKSVYLQAIVRGKWRTFATTEADSQVGVQGVSASPRRIPLSDGRVAPRVGVQVVSA